MDCDFSSPIPNTRPSHIWLLAEKFLSFLKQVQDCAPFIHPVHLSLGGGLTCIGLDKTGYQVTIFLIFL